MRLDHIAYRVKDRYKTAQFFIDTMKYKIETEFKIDFDDGTNADCLVLQSQGKKRSQDLPELFISDGKVGSIVGDWVKEKNGGGVHHLAYQVDDVEKTMNEWKDKGYVEFLTEKPLVCEDPKLTQIFTKPLELTGVIYELIERDSQGFCEKNTKKLMVSTESNKH